MPDAQGAKAYLLQCLKVDLDHHPQELLELRRLRRAQAQGETPLALKMPRQVLPRAEVEGVLRQLGEEFFSLAPEKLERRLAKVDTQDYPDLGRYKLRLERLAQARPDLVRALERRDVSPTFISSLQEILVLPQREAVEIKRKLLRTMIQPIKREMLERSALAVNTHFPRLVELDPDFFGQLAKAEKNLKDNRRPQTIGLGIGVFIILQVVFRLARYLLRD